MGDGFVEVGIEGLAFGVDGRHAGLGEGGFELTLDQTEAFEEGFGGVGLDAVGEAEVEIVERGEQVLEELFVGVDGPILAFAVDALAVVVEVGLQAEEAVPEDVFGGRGFFGGGDLGLRGFGIGGGGPNILYLFSEKGGF